MPASEAFEEIVENFSLFDDWEDRYRYVIDLGRDLPELEESRRTPASKVEGCTSQVWLVPEIEGAGPDAILRFTGESDAMIVQGLIAILKALYSGLAVKDVLEIDAPAELARLGLNDHLSAQRSNGLRAMVQRIRDISSAARAA